MLSWVFLIGRLLTKCYYFSSCYNCMSLLYLDSMCIMDTKFFVTNISDVLYALSYAKYTSGPFSFFIIFLQQWPRILYLQRWTLIPLLLHLLFHWLSCRHHGPWRGVNKSLGIQYTPKSVHPVSLIILTIIRVNVAIATDGFCFVSWK
jgi:hypothetical protein